ncbi:MAG TPA: NAD(P)H-hydrate dehydratase [Hydrogenophaga sp.]|uniref:NAD(P)H-hydrate dehydratase n=1 Tax=Hydrogenophaga sp. TaxID=1904254 RepID=UPI002CF696FF|nr:NAD(P)H-hydrate dehydratase [Hydrogenophaga sp.]HMN91912.1 NAD(P)H-hydrate dehydratase [Hydrogenophaga sp.]HMP08948.1 NAD(P)H-hydrate dehydratase [Hydrogenophaga sp.]
MRRITPSSPEPLFDAATTRQIERRAQNLLPAHALMDRAGLAVARLATALYPHARTVWIACGPGNNGGDGLRAAAHLAQWQRTGQAGSQVHLTHAMGTTPDPALLPEDARYALACAMAAGVRLQADPPEQADLVIDAMLGIGARNAPGGTMGHWLDRITQGTSPVLAVDVPSGLNADTGTWSGPALPADLPPRHTLSLLTLKPGLFTASGRDACGEVWFDDLDSPPSLSETPSAWLSPASPAPATRLHSSHKGSQGDVLVIGGQHVGLTGAGMTGAAVLAARAALHAGAGRVYLALLGDPIAWDPACPELMLRTPERILQEGQPESSTVVCGCGGGEVITPLLPEILHRSHRLVLDADALNAVAADTSLGARLRMRRQRGLITVITPHPLEAARLLGTDTASVMGNRLEAATILSRQLGAICVLKGSGTVMAAEGQTPHINASGNARLATAGTGDVLAGMLGASLRSDDAGSAFRQVCRAVARHGELADRWSAGTLTAARLIDRIGPSETRA